MISHGTQESFHARLGRIQSGKTTGWTDPGGGLASVRAGKQAAAKIQRKKESTASRLAYPMSFVWAALFGALAVVIARYVRYHMMGMTGAEGDMDLLFMLDAGMGVAVGFVLTELFKLSGKVFKVAQTVGVIAMVGLMHNLVWWYPDQVEMALGKDYVQDILATTEPNSFMFRGNFFVFDRSTALTNLLPAGQGDTPDSA